MEPDESSSVNPEDGAAFEPQIVWGDEDERFFTFAWDSTGDAPSGTEFTTGLFSYGWEDLVTETFVPFHYTSAYNVTYVIR